MKNKKFYIVIIMTNNLQDNGFKIITKNICVWHLSASKYWLHIILHNLKSCRRFISRNIVSVAITFVNNMFGSDIACKSLANDAIYLCAGVFHDSHTHTHTHTHTHMVIFVSLTSFTSPIYYAIIFADSRHLCSSWSINDVVFGAVYICYSIYRIGSLHLMFTNFQLSREAIQWNFVFQFCIPWT